MDCNRTKILKYFEKSRFLILSMYNQEYWRLYFIKKLSRLYEDNFEQLKNMRFLP